MMVKNSKISIKTKGNSDIIDITGDIALAVKQSGLKDGTITIFITGSTAGVTTIEYESGLIADFQEMWDKIVPRDLNYQHNLQWGDGNGHSHVRSSLLGASLVVPFINKSIILGTWQQIVIVDFDNRSRNREVFLQIIGEL
jgi:secondary thiamine-phosphate synthase enzyme